MNGASKCTAAARERRLVLQGAAELFNRFHRWPLATQFASDTRLPHAALPRPRTSATAVATGRRHRT